MRYALFIAQNLATLEYKVLEEPDLILHELERLQATTGQQILAQAKQRLKLASNEANRELSPLTDEEDGRDDDDDSDDESDENEDGDDNDDDDDYHVHTRRSKRYQNARKRRVKPSAKCRVVPKKREKRRKVSHETKGATLNVDQNLLALARAAFTVQLSHVLHKHLRTLYGLMPK